MMSTPPDLQKSVVLRLSADQSSGGDILFPERCIVLHPGKDSITIGRASKISTKGFIASTENAWFDSPVMSRLHARLSAKMDDRKIEIKDLGSLHGTFLNGDQRIPADEYVELRHGDVLRFGSPIWRGKEQFVPTTVKVGVQFPTRHGPSTFQVPDESDEEGLDDSESSDSIEIISANEAKKSHPAEQSIPAQTTKHETPVIDLTGAPSGYLPRHPFSLSTPCDSQVRIHDAREPASFVDSQVETAEDVIYDLSANYELGDAVADANLGDRTLVSDGMTELESGSPKTDAKHGYWYEFDEQDDGQEGESDDHNSLSEHSDDDSQIDYPDEESDSQMDSFDEGVSDEEMDSASTDDDDLQENVVVADGYAYTSEASDASEDGSLGLEPRNDYTAWEDPSQRSQSLEYPEIVPLIDSLSRAPAPSNPSQSVLGANAVASIDWLLNSDKPRPATPAMDHSEGATPSHSSPPTGTAAALGARTGKIDYFLAREDNKMALGAQKAACQRPTSVQDLCNVYEAADRLGSYSPATHPATSFFIPPSKENVSSPAESGPFCAFTPYEPRTTGSPVSVNGEVHGSSRRTYVCISDIVNGSQQNVSDRLEKLSEQIEADRKAVDRRIGGHGIDRKSKRKAEDISDTTDAEERWADSASKIPSPGPSIDENNTHPESPVETAQDLIGPSDHGGEHPTAEEQQSLERRPVKRARMMRVAERLGYAALGGVTAGAMIVGTLIYTAPTFG
jgi:hypothetical protein